MKKSIKIILFMWVLLYVTFGYSNDRIFMSYWSNGPRYQPYPIPGSINEKGMLQKNDDLAKKLNEINVIAYAFFPVDEQGYVYSNHPYIDLSSSDSKRLCLINHFCKNQNVTHVKSLGNLDAFSRINNAEGKLKRIISIGGASTEKSFINAINHPNHFVDSASRLIKALNLNGIDLDFELADVFTRKQADQYASIVRNLRQKLGLKYFISIEMPGDNETLDSIGRKNWAIISSNAYISIMGYEFHRYEYPTFVTANASNLYSDPNEPNIKNFCHISQDQALKHITYLGVPANKIILGFPAYFQAYSDVVQKNHGLYQPFNPKITPMFDFGAGRGSFQQAQTLLKNGYHQHYIWMNKKISAVYANNPKNKSWISYDNAKSVAYKAQYVLKNHLAGMMMWNIKQDVSVKNKESLLRSAHKTMEAYYDR